jgi:predicted Na+-dependent transporter
VDILALICMAAAFVMFVFAASGRELRHFNEIALGLVFLAAGADLPVHRRDEHAHRALTARERHLCFGAA